MTASPADLSIPEAGIRLRDGRLTSRALTEAHLARIAERDPTLHAFVATSAETAPADAARADRELADGHDRGPLHGVPVALKDLIDVAGLRTVCGSRLRAQSPLATSDAAVVVRLRAAGAILLGKLATYEFALIGTTFDGPTPPAVNPRSPDHVTGGSSSGAAAAVSAGLVRTALGTDTGGSIRSPAAYCGAVGLKPTFGRVPAAGIFPLAPGLDHVGAISASVAEAALTFDAIADHGAGIPPAAASLGRGVAGLRIAYARAWFDADPALDPAVLAAVDAAVDRLGQLGAHIARVALPDYAPLEAAGRTLLDAEAHAQHRATLAANSAGYGRAAAAALAAGADVDPAALTAARRAGANLRRTLDAAIFARHHALVTAVTLTTAPPVAPFRMGRTGWNPMRTLPFNMTGHPALALPAGLIGCLPVSVQIVGPHHGEAMVCRIGAALERRPSLLALDTDADPTGRSSQSEGRRNGRSH